MVDANFLLKGASLLAKAAADAQVAVKKGHAAQQAHFKWQDRAVQAYKNEYFLECIVICVNSINFQLRQTIEQAVFLNSLQKYRTALSDSYLSELLNDYDNPLLGKIDERKFYEEAFRLNLIDKDTKGFLHGLYSKRNRIFHSLFAGPNNEINKATEALKELAKGYLDGSLKCMQSLMNKTVEVDEEMKKITKEMQDGNMQVVLTSKPL